MNAVITALPQRWIYCGYNGEYLYYPFSETRRIGEIIAFTTEERRKTIPTTVVDLYEGHFGQSPDGVDVISTYLDRLGYYTETRRDDEQAPLPQQFNIYGGLRRRFEEHVPCQKGALIAWLCFKASTG
jgi:hypothetical protein